MPLIHHVIAGNGLTPIVFVHGFACGHSDWDAQVAHFSPRYQTVAVDLRGPGASPGSAADCSIERYGADVAEVMRALNLPPAVVVGHSLGCRVAIEAALQAPEHTRAVVLVDGSQFAAGMGPGLRAAFARPNGFASMQQGQFKAMFTAKSDPAVVNAVVERAVRLPREVGEKMMVNLQRYDEYRLLASLRSLTVPVMAIQTTFTNPQRQRSSLMPGQSSPYLDLLRAELPSVRIEIVEDTGHFPQLDEPERTNALLDNFMRAI